MTIFVILVGLALGLAGIFGVVSPGRLARKILNWPARSRFITAVTFRLVIGITFILAAPDTRFPTVILVLGIIALVAAFALILVGRKRFDALIEWWVGRPAGFTRGVSLLMVLLGGALVYAGI
jgi:hypothetical protein